MTLRGGTVCSGIGAPELAAPWIDWRWCSEIEEFPSSILRHHRPDVPNLGDMTKFREWPDDPIDILVGGTPCQSFSIAGLRKGLSDPRGNLALTFLAIAERFKPRWLVWENVPGVLSALSHDAPDPCPPDIDLDSDDGPADGEEIMVTDTYDADETHALWCFVAGAKELGYHGGFRVVDAQYARACHFPRAVPQRRRRVFFVGYLGDWRRAAAVLFDANCLSGNSAPRREAGQGIAPTIASRPTGGGGLGTDFDLDGGLVANSGDIAHCICASGQQSLDAETETIIAIGGAATHALTAEGFDASEDGTGRGTPVIAFGSKDSGGDACAGVCPTLRAGGFDTSHPNAGVPPAIAIQERATSENPVTGPDGAGIKGDGTSYTIEARGTSQAVAFQCRFRGDDGRGYDRAPPECTEVTGALETVKPWHVATPWAVRRLTPRECERLMGFPDDFTRIPWRGKPAAECPDGRRYKALGNSWAVNSGEYLLDRIRLVEDICSQSDAAEVTP